MTRDRRNRVGLATLGLCCGLVGGLGLALSLGAFGSMASHAPVITHSLAHHFSKGHRWSFVISGVVAVVAIAGGVWLAWGQLRLRPGLPRLGDYRPVSETVSEINVNATRGTTVVRAAPLAHALESDLERMREVGRASVGLYGTAPRLTVEAGLTVSDQSDLPRLSTEVSKTLTRTLRHAGLRPVTTDVTVRLTNTGSRVR